MFILPLRGQSKIDNRPSSIPGGRLRPPANSKNLFVLIVPGDGRGKVSLAKVGRTIEHGNQIGSMVGESVNLDGVAVDLQLL